MSDISAEKLAARILESGLMSQKEISQTIMSVGGETATLEDFKRVLVTNENLTNFQITRLIEGVSTSPSSSITSAIRLKNWPLPLGMVLMCQQELTTAPCKSQPDGYNDCPQSCDRLR